MGIECMFFFVCCVYFIVSDIYFFDWDIPISFLQESQQRQGRATQPAKLFIERVSVCRFGSLAFIYLQFRKTQNVKMPRVC